MAGWLDREQFAKQIASNSETANQQAQCPSDFPESSSYWIEDYPIDFEKECQAASVPEQVDVVVIGTGITAAATLHILAERRPDLKVAAFDARGICSGATGRNGGQICRAEGTDLRQLVEERGKEEAARITKLGTRNRDLMLAAAEKVGIINDIDLRLEGTRIVFASQEERDVVESERACAEELGIQVEGRILDTEELCRESRVSPAVAKFGGDCIDKSGSIHPRKLVAGLLRDAMKRLATLTIHPYTPVDAVDQATNDAGETIYTVKTTKGRVQCRAVVHATNAWASYLIPRLSGVNGVLGCKAEAVAIQPRAVAHGSTAMNQATLHGGLGYEEFWHYAIQRSKTGPLIYGWAGAEHVGVYDDSCHLPHGEDGKPAGAEVMENFLKTTFPKQFPDVDWDRDVVHRWTGIQGFTQSGASLVGRHSKEKPGEFMSVGHNGEGMGRCFASATVMTDLMIHYLEGKPEGAWEAPAWFPQSFLRNI